MSAQRRSLGFVRGYLSTLAHPMVTRPKGLDLSDRDVLNRAVELLEEFGAIKATVTPVEGEEQILAQAIADSYFAMEAGQSWREGGYPRPEVHGGHMQLAVDIIAAGFHRWKDAVRAGYDTARQDMISGAFTGGPTYLALKNSFTGKQIAKDAIAAYREENGL